MDESPSLAPKQGGARLDLHSDPRATDIIRRCYSHVEVLNREGGKGVGVTNLKRVFGRPSELRVLVEALAATVREADALASVDQGSAPLAAVVAYELSLPALFVRPTPKKHLLSYGGDPTTNIPASRASGLLRAAPSISSTT